jgi:hypothetical protein
MLVIANVSSINLNRRSPSMAASRNTCIRGIGTDGVDDPGAWQVWAVLIPSRPARHGGSTTVTGAATDREQSINDNGTQYIMAARPIAQHADVQRLRRDRGGFDN